MPGPTIAKPAYPQGTPDWLQGLLTELSLSPAGGLKAGSPFTGPTIKILGKTVKDALGTIFTAPAESGLPRRLRFVNYNTRDKLLHLRSDDAARTRLDIPLGQLEQMLEQGAIGVQPRPQAVRELSDVPLKRLSPQRRPLTPPEK